VARCLFALANKPTGKVFALANKPTGKVFALANKPTGKAFALANKPTGKLFALANAPTSKRGLQVLPKQGMLFGFGVANRISNRGGVCR
jgi:hypothetical protein